nr:cob(I)yrinic acid a,c-diamide adenosyltransferase [Desulfobacter latus]
MGLALRAAGAGLGVFIVQFMKQGMYSEINALKKFDKIFVEQYGAGKFVKGTPSDVERAKCRQGYERLCRIIEAGNHDLIIADEANMACSCGLLSAEDLLHLIDIKPEHIELVITGRGAPASVMDRADLVTEMTAIKHYYKQGVAARIGIEK